MIGIQTFTSRGNRAENQDFIAYLLIDDESGIFVVADGMGGYEHGDIAAKVVAESIVESVFVNWSTGFPSKILADAMSYANESLSLKRIALGGRKMGAVVCALILHAGKAYISWLGDSRVYHYSGGIEDFHTRDHSMVQELLKINSLKASDIEKYSNIVTRSVMGNVEMDPLEMEIIDYKPGDSFILCSDGLHKTINMSIKLKEEFCKQLLERDDNYNDNATCIIINIG